LVQTAGRRRAALSKKEGGINMARKPGTRTGGEFVLFDVIYEDGSQRSNRRVPAGLLGGLDEDEPAKAAIAEQDAAIAEKSGIPPQKIKTIKRSGSK
jgi:hypothetical protein